MSSLSEHVARHERETNATLAAQRKADADDLADAVEALTKPIITGVPEKNAAGKWVRVREVQHEALLTQMRNAIQPSGENNGGAATAANERVPLDTHMLYEYAKIASQIGGWAIEAELHPARDAIMDLERWHAVAVKDKTFDGRWHTRQLRKWEQHIRRLLAKSGNFIIEAPCPICGATEWGNMIDGGGLYPIKVEYVIGDDGRLSDHSALCQACRVVWEGYDSVTELADELAEKEAI